jgi:hypothetical protein
MKIQNEKRGFILLLTLIFMTVLTVFTGSLIYMTTADMKNSAPLSDDVNLAGLADAGIDRAHRAIRDFFLTNAQTGSADLRGGSTTGSSSITTPEHMMHIDGPAGVDPTLAQLTPAVAIINNNNDIALLRTFDSNYTNTRILSVQVRFRVSRATGGQATSVRISYSTATAPSYTTLITQVIPSSRTLAEYSATLPSPGPSGWDWSTGVAGLMNPDLIFRAVRSAGNRDIYIDAIYLRVTYEIDVPPANWATGEYAAFPINLYGSAGDGQIEYARIGEGGNLGALYYEETSEQGKVHLNYASLQLLTNLLAELNIASASTKAQAIVNYRTGPPFNYFGSVEELKQVSAITQADYDSIKNFVTVYSFANKNTQRPPGPVNHNYRAPVNINTAPRQVLEAVFDPLPIGSTDAASLAADIVSARSTPFTCFYSFNTAVTTDFYDFVNSRGYLTTAEKQAVWDNADASLIPAAATVVTPPNAVTTEFCYTGDVFKINSLANVYVTDAAKARRLRVHTMRGGTDGRRALEIYDSGTPPAISAGYRRGNHE